MQIGRVVISFTSNPNAPFVSMQKGDGQVHDITVPVAIVGGLLLIAFCCGWAI